MNLSKLVLVSVVVVLQALAPVARAEGNSGGLQAMIDAAAPGAVVNVPAGTYQGSIVLRDSVTLVGEGAESTTIDGNGAAVVVSGARNATLMGLTIRNGRTAVGISQTSMHIFECAIRDFQDAGVSIDRGCAVIVNNLIEGGPLATGIICRASNPYVSGNTVVSNAVGVYLGNRSAISLVNNVFFGNSTAILAVDESSAYLESNIFDRNGQNVVGLAFGASDTIAAVALDGKVPHRGGSLESYRKLTEVVLQQKMSEQQVVIYDLRNDLGRFDMIVLSSWASFAIAASTPDTEVIEHAAHDFDMDRPLHSMLFRQSLPLVAVINPEIKDVKTDRYVLSCLYNHPPSYLRNEKGQLQFRRLTNITRVNVIVPPGYAPVSVNYPSTIEQADGCQVVKIIEVGPKQIDVLMAPVNP